MSWQYVTVQLKNQTRNIVVRSAFQSRPIPTAKIKCSVAYSCYIYGEHVSPVILVPHTRYDNSQADIPEKGKDPTTSWVMQMKISRDTSHVMQGSTSSRADNAESTVLIMVTKVNIPAPDKDISWTLVILLYDWPQQWALYSYKPRVYVIFVRTPGQKISTRNNAKNIALTTSMVIRRIKDMCGQVILVRYPDKENHDRQRMRLTAKVWWFFARPSGSGYPSRLEAMIPYGSTKAYPQRPTPFYKDFISRWPA